MTPTQKTVPPAITMAKMTHRSSSQEAMASSRGKAGYRWGFRGPGPPLFLGFSAPEPRPNFLQRHRLSTKRAEFDRLPLRPHDLRAVLKPLVNRQKFADAFEDPSHGNAVMATFIGFG